MDWKQSGVDEGTDDVYVLKIEYPGKKSGGGDVDGEKGRGFGCSFRT